MAPSPKSAFLSIQPLEPVLVFDTPEHAKQLHSKCLYSRILHPTVHPRWVYVPLPAGLLNVFSEHDKCGFAFTTLTDAEKFNNRVEDIGQIRESGDHNHWKVLVPKS